MGSVNSKTKPTCWTVCDLLIIGWLRKNNKVLPPLDVIRVIEWFYYEPIVPYCIYSIQSHSQYDTAIKKRYLSHVTSNGRCRQIYETYQESQYRFIPVNKYENTFKIQNVYPDQQFAKYISIQTINNNKCLQVAIRNIENAKIFKLIMVHNKGENMLYKIKYIENNKHYLVGTETHNLRYEYNQLHPVAVSNNTSNKTKQYRQISSNFLKQQSIKTENDELISYDYISIYSKTQTKYLSFHDYTKFIRQIYDTPNDSQFELVIFDENDSSYFIRNIFEPGYEYRYNFWIGFEIDDDEQNNKKLRIYKDDKKRAIFKFVNKGYNGFNIYVYDKNEYENGGWLGHCDGGWNVLYDDKNKADEYQVKVKNMDEYIFNYAICKIDNNVINIKKTDVYALWSFNNKHYLSYQTSTAKAREIYDNPRDSQLKCIKINDNDKDLYYIQNEWKDERLNYWMGFEFDKNTNKFYVKFYQNESEKATWKFVPIDDDDDVKKNNNNIDSMMLFKLYGYYSDTKRKQTHKGWLCAEKNGNWNMLSMNESDAFLYSPRLLSTRHI